MTAGSALSPRERDCLELMAQGLLSHEVAARLGISQSTLNKHLASARSRLGVSRTAHALLALERGEHVASAEDGRAAAEHPGSVRVPEFKESLNDCRDFSDAWAKLRRQLDTLGISYGTLGFSAAPAVQFAETSRMCAVDMPGDIAGLHDDGGGVDQDPVAPLMLQALHGIVIDNEAIYSSLKPVRHDPMMKVGEAFLDNHCSYMYSTGALDHLTGALLGANFIFDQHELRAFRNRQGERVRLLRELMAAFAAHVIDNGMLAPFAGLTPRQRQALVYAARGFTVEETAEHLAISRRATEKLLSAARKVFAAKTTAVAVYRATAFRALA